MPLTANPTGCCPDTILTGCCPNVGVRRVLTAQLDGEQDCNPCADGTVPITFGVDEWTGETNLTTSPCNLNLKIRLRCLGIPQAPPAPPLYRWEFRGIASGGRCSGTHDTGWVLATVNCSPFAMSMQIVPVFACCGTGTSSGINVTITD